MKGATSRLPNWRKDIDDPAVRVYDIVVVLVPLKLPTAPRDTSFGEALVRCHPKRLSHYGGSGERTRLYSCALIVHISDCSLLGGCKAVQLDLHIWRADDEVEPWCQL